MGVANPHCFLRNRRQLGIDAEFRRMPAAMLATPWTHVPSNAKGRPTDRPETGRDQRQDKVQGMIYLCPDEDLLVLTPWTMCTYFVFSHLWGRPATSNLGEPSKP
jgi:hypothetical protein